MKYFCVYFLVLLSGQALAAGDGTSNRPQLHTDFEVGERYVPLDGDFTTEDFKNESSYRFTIGKVQLKQKLSPQALVSIFFKTNSKDYRLDSDTDLNNTARTIAGYLNFKISDGLKIKIDGRHRNLDFKEPVSQDNNNTWNQVGLTLFMHPRAFTVPFFMLDSKNRYQVSFRHKRVTYVHDSLRDGRDTILNAKWKRNITPAFAFRSKARIYIKNFDTPSNIRKNAVRQSVGIGFDYQF